MRFHCIIILKNKCIFLQGFEERIIWPEGYVQHSDQSFPVRCERFELPTTYSLEQRDFLYEFILVRSSVHPHLLNFGIRIG